VTPVRLLLSDHDRRICALLLPRFALGISRIRLPINARFLAPAFFLSSANVAYGAVVISSQFLAT
jgi:hypothetical protein